MTTLEHSPYSTDLAPDDINPFPRLKSPLNGRHFGVAALTKWLPGMLQTPGKVHSCTRGLTEGNVAYMFVLFCISEKYSVSGNNLSYIVRKKVKQSRYRPGVVQRDPGI